MSETSAAELVNPQPPGVPVRRLPIGAEPQPGGGVHFRLWAPRCREVVVAIDGLPPIALQPEGGGYFSGWAGEARPGLRYRLRTDGAEPGWPDPASRFQPDGPHGPSEIVDPAAFAWTDRGWLGRAREELIIYEMHIGTFTPEGNWDAAARQLPVLAEFGITCLEIMPVADFPGRFGWGYDGVDLFAPTRLYGRPDDFRRFVDRAHGLGLAVILDVVYNHFGPDGNYLGQFSQSYVTDRHANEWGEAIDFDGPDSGPVRESFIANAGYWIDEYHLDGLRLDATHAIHDASDDHILTAIGRRVRQAGAGRTTFIAAENDRQEARLARPPERGGSGLDAIWNDDFHHSAKVALTGRREFYYRDYHGRAGEFVAAAKHGFLYQGQGRRHGSPAFDLAAECFVVFLQNHDQIAHSGAGLRLHALTSPGRWRAMTAFMLLMPGVPLLFQGEEFAASAPFLFFADHQPPLADAVRRGRREFLANFASLAGPEMQGILADPADPETFRRCILDLSERDRHAAAYKMHRELLRLRRGDPVLSCRPAQVDGAVLNDEAWLLRFFAGDADRLLLVNLGPDLSLAGIPEPLLAPVEGQEWRVLWSSEAPIYGGTGTPALYQDGALSLPGESALLLAPGPVTRP